MPYDDTLPHLYFPSSSPPIPSRRIHSHLFMVIVKGLSFFSFYSSGMSVLLLCEKLITVRDNFFQIYVQSRHLRLQLVSLIL